MEGTLKPGFKYQVKWSRGVKVATTTPILATKESAKTGININEKLSLLVTLYKDDSNKFDTKDAKIALVTINQKNQVRSVGKVHFDLSQYAGVPTASVQRMFTLSDKLSLKTTVESRFLKAGGKGPGSGASSALSGVSARSSDDFDDDLDDFDDLAVDDVPEPEVVTASAVRSKRAPPPAKPAAKPQQISPQDQPSPASRAASAAEPSSSAPRKPEGHPSAKSSASSQRRPRPGTVRQEDISALRRAEEEAKLAQIAKDNQRLSTELQQARNERKSLEQSHKRQIDELNDQLQLRRREISDSEAQRSSSVSELATLRSANEELKQSLDSLTKELGSVKRSRDEYRSKSKTLSASEEKCRKLAREVDRLTVVAAQVSSSSDAVNENSEIQERMLSLRKEKESLEKRIKDHESHSHKVKEAYESLANMYNKVRDENIKLSERIEEQQKDLQSQSVSLPALSAVAHGDTDELRARLEDALQEVRDEKAGKDSLQSDHDRMNQQLRSMESRVQSTTKELKESQEEARKLNATIENLKIQRDNALRDASGGEKASTMTSRTTSPSEADEEVRALKQKLEKEQTQFRQRQEELENELMVLKEDVQYEKAEKEKARDDRDKLRDRARTLERKTSQAAKQADELHALRRQLSTVQMREKDQAEMIKDLRGQVKQLQSEVDDVNVREKSKPSSNVEDVGEVLHDLVATKLALAQAEDEKLQLQFSMRKLRKSERMAQQRLAAHASRLEVKLGQANEELEKYRKEKKGGHVVGAREFNELDSDIDY